MRDDDGNVYLRENSGILWKVTGAVDGKSEWNVVIPTEEAHKLYDEIAPTPQVHSPPPALATIIKRNKMLMLNNNRGSWKKLWVEISDHYLNTFKKEKENEFDATIDLYQTGEIKLMEADEYGDSCFNICFKNKTYIFKTDSLDQATSWVEAMTKVKEQGPQELMLGIYLLGTYNLSTYPRAVELLRVAVEKNDAVATAWLARCYFNGQGVEENKETGQRLAKSALSGLTNRAMLNDVSAQYSLGDMYFKGLGVNKDVSVAKSWFRHAANLGHAKAKEFLDVTSATI